MATARLGMSLNFSLDQMIYAETRRSAEGSEYLPIYLTMSQSAWSTCEPTPGTGLWTGRLLASPLTRSDTASKENWRSKWLRKVAAEIPAQ
jgi:hypothetical protein